MNYRDIASLAEAQGLEIVGAFHPGPSDAAPEGCKTLFLFGPLEPGFWARITDSPEYRDPDPVDRWSERVLDALARTLNATAVFPFGGPPYQPFMAWALGTGRIWQSPVGLLVHDKAGLFVSFRGALAFSVRIELPDLVTTSPCLTCRQKPCLSACPPKALRAKTYDVASCHRWLDNDQGEPCLAGGCLVRRSCPISQNYGRLATQSAHHMRAFHKG